jgi:hypothetical protein
MVPVAVFAFRHRPGFASLQSLLLTFCLVLPPWVSSAQTVSDQSAPSPSPAQAPTSADLRRAIALAAGYLERSSAPDGKFTYQIDVLSGKESSSYNIVRHAGAMYSLGMLSGGQRDASSDAALVRAASYLTKHYIAAGPYPGTLTVWADPQPADSKADLGATGLALVALIAARRVDPSVTSLADLQALGRFILSLQNQDGSFVHRYRPKTGNDLQWRSLYYPGEAALGLLSLYELDHSQKWFRAAGKALTYLAKSRAGSTEVPQDHWALIATAKFLPYCLPASCSFSRADLLRHAIQICQRLLSEQVSQPGDPSRDGAFDPDGRVAPTAISIEGLLAATEFLPHDNFELRSRIIDASSRGVAFLLRAQTLSGPYAGGMPRAYVSGSPRKMNVRIDYVQHSMSAWIRYQRLLASQ